MTPTGLLFCLGFFNAFFLLLLLYIKKDFFHSLITLNEIAIIFRI